MNKNILFLTLRVFSATGGIEKVCRIFCKVLAGYQAGMADRTIHVFSMYDAAGDINPAYLDASFFKGFAAQKIKFIFSSVKQAALSDVIVLSHINLLSVGCLIKLLYPKKKILLFAHGIEVWDNLSGLRKKMLQRCNLILCVSQFTMDNIKQQFKNGAPPMQVLNNCIDPFLPAPGKSKRSEMLLNRYGFKQADIILMTLTRLSSKELYKGYDRVIYAVHTLKKKYPSIKYLIVGRYDDEEKKRIDALIGRYGLEQQVILPGYIPDAELAEHYQLADVYVMPSKKEGFGIVFIEAMYYGLPVIAGNKDGSVDALCNGKLGILVNPDDQDAINTSLENVLAARDKFIPDVAVLKEHFSFNTYSNKVNQLLSNL